MLIKSSLAKLVLKGPIVRLLVDVIQLVQSVQHVIRPRVNALATLDTLVQLVIPVPPTFLLKWVELVQVSIII